MEKLIFIDTETTGTGPEAKIIQVAYKTSDGVEVNKFYNPEIPIEIEAMAVHHITEKMVKDKPLFRESTEYLDLKKRFEAGEIFVAHNAKFDIEMLRREGLKVGSFIDTLKVARYLDTQAKIPSYAMQYLRYFLKIEVEANAHDAWGDILVLEKLFYRLIKKIMEKENINKEKALEKMMSISQKPSLIRSIHFGKYKGEKLEEIAKKDPAYLRWLLSEKEKEEEKDEDWIYSLKHYLHLVS